MAARVTSRLRSLAETNWAIKPLQSLPLIACRILSNDQLWHFKGVCCFQMSGPTFPKAFMINSTRSLTVAAEKDGKENTNLNKKLFELTKNHKPKPGILDRLDLKFEAQFIELMEQGAASNASYEDQTVEDKVLEWPYYQRIRAIELIEQNSSANLSSTKDVSEVDQKKLTFELMMIVMDYVKTPNPDLLIQMRKLRKDGASIELPIFPDLNPLIHGEFTVKDFIVENPLKADVRKTLYRTLKYIDQDIS